MNNSKVKPMEVEASLVIPVAEIASESLIVSEFPAARTSPVSFTGTTKDGKLTIKKDLAFCGLLGGVLPPLDKSLSGLLKELDEGVRTQAPRTTGGALSNCHGDWYEWLLASAAWNRFVESLGTESISNIALLLPNVSQFNAYSFYDSKRTEYIADLRAKLSVLGVELVTSNPDFVIFDGTRFSERANSAGLELNPVTSVTPDILQKLENAHEIMVDSCDLDDLVGYFSVKSSLRPDRRLQISHEGSLMKAMYVHMQTREWIIDPKGIKYYAISTNISEADKTGLKTVATHSITTVSTAPMAAVDDAFCIDSLASAREVFQQIL